ncbi:chemotaxis response regulator protein-glutamate methylesterase [Paenibacillus sp. R14(2021)]|uniref:protein-glutamate methylesterase/protein-glutamine glutaminase n=1 Tax=Paenibacillus sp. R14(2021) TaxID=2859228 RepID=UPI001C613103|nr:chemotaxis response regulator protein-glutamate methylesterase [Paenibacillus sp. R14(2021)]
MNVTSRVLVVDDSAFMRKIICDLIAEDAQFEILATATNGCEAIEAVRALKPDVITMDLEMPEMNGLEALERIMRIHPVPVIMLSSISDDGTRETIKALQNGAFDFIRKPSGPLSPDIKTVGEQLLEKLRIAVLTKRHSSLFEPKITKQPASAKEKPPQTTEAAKPPALKQPNKSAKAEKQEKAGKTAAPERLAPKKQAEPPIVRLEEEPEISAKSENEPAAAKTIHKPKPSKTFRHLVAIGTSTGGPRALHEVITSLPGDFPAPVLIVQHMPPKFTRSLAQRLDAFSALHVTEAVQGERVYAGMVYIAPGGSHMELAKDGAGYFIKLSEDAPRGGHRPSVDTMFESCAGFPELRRHSVIMTGMGNDGVKGMKQLMESGAETAIAEAEESCVVYGMPRAAVEAGVAKTVVPLKQIAPALTSAVTQ